MGAGRERPPIEEVAVADRDRAVVLGDAAAHFLEDGLDQRLVRRHRRFVIGILGAQIGEHVLVVDDRVGLVLQPVPGVLDADAVALVAVGALRRDRRRGKRSLGGHCMAFGLGGGGRADRYKGGDQQAHRRVLIWAPGWRGAVNGLI